MPMELWESTQEGWRRLSGILLPVARLPAINYFILMTMARSYVICTTPRSGSTLLCNLMKSTGQAGQPESYFRQQSIRYWIEQLNVPVQDIAAEPEIDNAYLEAIRREGAGNTDCFGLRLMWESLDNLSNCLEGFYPDLSDDAARFDIAFGQPKYLHLSRGDKVAQAVSLLKAEQTGLWHIGSGGVELERTGPPCTPVYDRARIAKIVTDLELQYAGWTEWFEKYRLNPVRINYETLSASPKLVLAGILSALGIAPEISTNVEPATAKLADEVSAQWISRYHAETG